MVNHSTARDWLTANVSGRVRAHAAGHVTHEAARLGDRWRAASPHDLLGEIRDEVAAVLARCALTAEALDARTALRSDQRAQLDATLVELAGTLDAAHATLTRTLVRGRGLHEPVEADDAASAEPHVDPSGRSTKGDRAAAIIREQLANGPRPVAELLDVAEQAGVSRATVYKAAEQLGVERQRGQRASTWALPGAAALDAADADRERAAAMIADALADGDWHPAGGVLALIVGAGIEREAAWAAAKQLGVERERHDGRATWRLPAHAADVEREAAA